MLTRRTFAARDAFEVRREYSRGKGTDAASIPVVIVYRW